MNTFETLNRIYCKDLEDLKSTLKVFKDSKYGSTSTIYEYKNLLMKIIKTKFIRETIDVNKELMNIHLILKHINLNNVLKAKKLLISNKCYFGYTMEKVSGKRLYEIPDNTKIDDLKISLNEIDRDIKKLAKNNIITTDLNSSNILYDYKTNKSTIIDTDAYLHDINTSKDSILAENMREFAFCIYHSFKNNIMYDKTIDNEIIRIIYNRLDYMDNITDFIDSIVELVENYTDTEIRDIKTYRKSINIKNNNY